MGKDDTVLRIVREICLALPDTKETLTWGEPHFRVGEKIFCGCGPEGGRTTVTFKLEKSHAEILVNVPGFRRAPYVGRHGWVSMDASRASKDREALRELILESYRLIAPKTSVARLGSGDAVDPRAPRGGSRRRAPRAKAPRGAPGARSTGASAKRSAKKKREDDRRRPRARKVRGFIGVVLAHALSIGAEAAAGAIELRLSKDPEADAIRLDWTGGQAPFRVLRGASAPALGAAGDTAAPAWTEAEAGEPIVFYRVDPIALEVTMEAAGTGGAVVAGTWYPSSSRLLATWAPALASLSPAIEGALLAATDPVTGERTEIAAPAGATSAEVPALYSETVYVLTLEACLDPACVDTVPVAGGEASHVTPQEAWQLRGTGSSISGLTRVVPDGNVKIHAFRYGADAPPAQAGRVQLYYGPMQPSFKGLAVGAGTDVVTRDPATASAFASLAGSSGLISPSAPAPLVAEVATGQAVPLAAATGGVVRLYFEARGADGKTRILAVDSRDGWVGRDFHSGAPTVCSTSSDYAAGGPCAPAVAVGVAGDSVGGNPGINNARQFKIGFPTLDDWRWGLEPGTFMVFTTDPVAGCTPASHNQVYAVWTGSAWQVQRHPSGCPKLFASAQAAAPLHLGGARYKLLFGDPSISAGRIPGSMLPFLGPKLVVYGDGARTGDPSIVDFEDWDPRSRVRGTTFLWPSGAVLNDTAEGYIDDFALVSPTAEIDYQVLYVAITDGSVPPFTSIAVLVNP